MNGSIRCSSVVELLRLLQDVGRLRPRHHGNAVFVGGHDVARVDGHTGAGTGTFTPVTR